MAETVKLPAFGEQKKSTVYIVGGLVVVVVAVGYYRSKKAAASAVPSGQGIDSTSIDPATGFAYGSAEDAAALNSQASYIQPAQYGYGGGTDTSTGVITQPTAGGFVSNAQWTQAAEAYAETLGSDVTTVASALGHYLAGVPLSPGEVDLVQQAIASQGYPPQAGTNGYPPSYRTATLSTATTTTKKYDVLHPPPGTKYVADGDNHNILYEIWPTDGKPRYISMADYIALGSPKYTVVHHLFPKK